MKRPNHERIIYHKLQQFQEQLLENYQPPDIEYSISDYHHATIQPIRRSSTTAPLPPLGSGFSYQSQFSLLEPGVRRPKKSHSQRATQRLSVAETEGTEGSYDPFRPSKTRIAPTAQGGRTRVTLLQGPSLTASRLSSSRVMSKSSMLNSVVPRLQDHDGYSLKDIPSAMRGSHHDYFIRMASNQRRISRGNSRVTIMSKRSANSSSSVIVVRKAPSYKRNVSFVRNQRKRDASGRQQMLRSKEAPASPFTLHQQYLQGERDGNGKQHEEITASASQPQTSIQETSEYEGFPLLPPLKSPRKRPRLHSPDDPRRTPSQHVAQDARKISTELAQLIDEAWNRESMASTIGTTSTPATNLRDSQHSYASPATSISVGGQARESFLDSQSRMSKTFQADVNLDHLLPQPPVESLSSQGLSADAKREIAKTRDMLKARARDSVMTPGYLDEIIAHLDRLMQPSQVRLADEERRAISTPDPSTGMPRKDTFDKIMEENHVEYRAASDPTQNQKNGQKPSTIRVVREEYRELSPVQPLTIRKKSSSSGPSSGSRTPTQQSFQQQLGQLETGRIEERSAGLPVFDNQGLNPVNEDDDDQNFDPIDRHRNPYPRAEPQKWSWFRRHQRAQPSRDTDIGPPPLPAKDQRPLSDIHQPSGIAHSQQKTTNEQTAPPLRKKRSIFGLFSSKVDGKHASKSHSGVGTGGDYDIDDEASESAEDSPLRPNTLQNNGSHTILDRQGRKKPSREHHRRNASTATQLIHAPPANILPPRGPQNWLARLLNLKPATLTLYLCISKPQARREITLIFRSWRTYGLRDINISKASSSAATTISARVDKQNALNIKEVEIAMELHTVLFRGRKAGLSVARLRQVRGSKGSFLRVAKGLEGMLGGKGWLVEDEKVIGEIRRGVGF